jgi:hypothetical protein
VPPDEPLGIILISKKGYAPLDPSLYFDKTLLRPKSGDALTRDFELNPAAHISGHIVDLDSGKPLAGFVAIAAAQQEARFGIMAAANPSAADGSFAIIADLNPGQYKLEIHPLAGSKRPDSGYGRSWFPGVTREEMAAPITLSAGETRDIELRLQERELHHIAGIIQVPEGREHDGITITLTVGPRAAFLPIAEAELAEAGPFRIDGLAEGTYLLAATIKSQGLPGLAFAGRTVEITDRSVDDLRLTMRNGVRARAIVTMAEEQIEPPAELQFSTEAAKPYPFGTAKVVFRSKDRLLWEGIPPGQYWPMLQLPKGYAVTSVTFNGQPVVNTPIDLETPESTVEFVLTSRPAAVIGIVRDDNQNAIPEASVALLPESLPGTSLHVVTSDASGAFRFSDLAPGRYKAVALAGKDTQHARDPVFLRDRQRPADAVILDFGQTATLDLVVK